MGIKLSMIKILLLIFILITILPALLFAADGFGVNANGGAAGINVNVANATDFTIYANSSLPYIITVSGSIILSGNLNITSNKTIQGADSNATVIGNLKIGNDSRNVIVQNLNITNPGGVGDGDGITIQGAKNIFITHCTFTDCADGSVDIVNQADSVTISWCRFRYIQQTSHCYVNLIGNSDSSTDDLGYLHVTIHHCW